MALPKEIWEKQIQKQLFLNDQFLNTVGLDHSMYVDNKTVHIPQAGSNPTVSVNLTSFPAAVGSRTDVDLTYDMNIYYTQPIRVGLDETAFLSYEKRASVLDSHLNKLRNVIGNRTLYSWGGGVPTASIVRTSGTATAKALAPSATGTRKAPTVDDLFDIRNVLGMQNLNPNDPIYGIIPENMYWEMVKNDNIKKYLEWGAAPIGISGEVPMVAGITLLRRSAVTVWDNTGTPVIKTIGSEGTPSSPATSDNQGALFISNSYVSKAMGAIKVYDENNSPTYYGDIISATVIHGASKMRTNGEGIVALVQSA